MTLPPLPDAAIRLGASAPDWRAAVALAGDGLVDAGAATPAYTLSMQRMIDEHGPYVVIAPGLALAHARPGPEVRDDGLAVATLAEPVPFGHPHNDPVRVVLALASSSGSHLPYIAAIANVFNDSDAIERLAAAADPDAVRAILGAPAARPDAAG